MSVIRQGSRRHAVVSLLFGTSIIVPLWTAGCGRTKYFHCDSAATSALEELEPGDRSEELDDLVAMYDSVNLVWQADNACEEIGPTRLTISLPSSSKLEVNQGPAADIEPGLFSCDDLAWTDAHITVEGTLEPMLNGVPIDTLVRLVYSEINIWGRLDLENHPSYDYITLHVDFDSESSPTGKLLLHSGGYFRCEFENWSVVNP